MHQGKWTHEEPLPAGVFSNPYVFWYETYGQNYDAGYPGDRQNDPRFWIVRANKPQLQGASRTSADAQSELGDYTIARRTPWDPLDEKAPIPNHPWHRAPLHPDSVPPVPVGKLADAPKLKPAAQGLKKPEVVVAVIDDATNFAHQRFQGPNRTSRVDYAWVMDGTLQNPSSPTVPFGREWSKPEIERVLQSSEDEGGVLQELELADFARNETLSLAKRTSHGTHIMDLACGYDPDDPAGHSVRIISVQLPRRVILEASGSILHLFVEAALKYIEARAREIAVANGLKNIPLVVNFSYGLGAGSRRGSHPIEKSLSGLTNDRSPGDTVNPVHIVLPAGNRFRSEGHAVHVADSAGPQTLDLNWMITPQDPSPNFLEIWVPSAASDASVVVIPPDARFGGAARIEENSGYLVLSDFQSGEPIAWIAADTETGTSGEAIGKTRVFIALAPTHVPRVDKSFCPSGVWKVHVSANMAAGQSICAWIQRDERPYTYRRPGRPSRLLDLTTTPAQRMDHELVEHGDMPLSPGGITGFGTLNGIATVENAAVVAGHRWRDLSSASYSSAGSAYVQAPDISAVCDRSRVLGGILAAGSRTGSKVALNGTSVAVPQVVRSLTEELRSARLSVATRIKPIELNGVERTTATDPRHRELDRLRGRDYRLSASSGGVDAQLDLAFHESRLIRKP